MTTSRTLITSGACSSDDQLVQRLSDAMVIPSASTGSVSSSDMSQVLHALENKNLDALLPNLISWVRSEIASTKLANPLQETVTKHMTFNKIMGRWETMCSCGEHRTHDQRLCLSLFISDCRWQCECHKLAAIAMSCAFAFLCGRCTVPVPVAGPIASHVWCIKLVPMSWMWFSSCASSSR